MEINMICTQKAHQNSDFNSQRIDKTIIYTKKCEKEKNFVINTK